MSQGLMQGYEPDGSRSTGSYHGDPHPWEFACADYPLCRPAMSDDAPPIPAPQPIPSASPRASALREAERLITGDRNSQYGPPTQDFSRTADLLNALGYRRVDADDRVHDIVMSDVAIMVSMVKISRLMHSRGKRDSWVDLAGYAACGYECATEEEKSA